MEEKPARWIQRFANFRRAYSFLKDAVGLSKSRPLSQLEEQGLIQAFEFTHELAWNVLRDYFRDQGNTSITGSKDAVREAFQKGLIIDGSAWMEMIRSRNATAHTYNQEVAREIINKIQMIYEKSFHEFEKTILPLTTNP
jgi:nucleotidyltransferase substrate binding protein (TIGR01987 family)